MEAINARSVNAVNALSGNGLQHYRRMGQQAEADPSPFWQRLEEAWKPKNLPTTQNGVATVLDMSQGSTRRWYLGEGFPETATIIDIAERGGVTVDWLLTGRLPKYPVDPGTSLGFIHHNWDRLGSTGEQHVLEAVEGRLAVLQRQEQAHDKGKASK